MLFDDGPRVDTGPAAYSEGRFVYYNRSARPEVGRIRDLLERWLVAYPAKERPELVTRLRLDGDAFDSAFLELFVHQLLLALGHEVEVHPEVGPDRLKRPDFLARERDSGRVAYVEAVCARAEAQAVRREKTLHARIQDDLNAFFHPDFTFILRRLHGTPTHYPKKARLHGFLAKCTEGLDVDTLRARAEAGAEIGEGLVRAFEHEGLRLELSPWPKPRHSRGDRTYRTVGAGPMEVIRSSAREAISSAIKTKAGRYGDLSEPYLVVVNCQSRWGVEEHEADEAILGQEQVVFRGGREWKLIYDGEGAFTHRSKPTNTRVSGALVLRDLTPDAITRAPVRLYHHFASKHPYLGALGALPAAQLMERTLSKVDGKNLETIFGLWPEWPFDPGDARGKGWVRTEAST